MSVLCGATTCGQGGRCYNRKMERGGERVQGGSSGCGGNVSKAAVETVCAMLLVK